MLRYTPVPAWNTLFTCLIILAFGCIGANSWAASPGLPFTEVFSDSSLQDSSQTNANWSTEQQAVYLQWRDHVRAAQVSFPASGVDVGTETDNTDSIAIGDVDGDGDLDVVAGNNGQNKWYANDGDSAPFSGVTTGTAIGTDTDVTRSISLADVDGDGDLDVVAGNNGQTNKWYANDGDSAPFSGVTTGTAIGTDTDLTRSISLADVNADGDLDVVAGNNGQTNKWYANDGDSAPFSGVTTGTAIGTDSDSTLSIAVGDVDGDGDLDVVAGNNGQNQWYANDGDSAPFSGVTTGTAIGTDTDVTRSIAVGDMDGDGDLDVIAGNITGATNKWYANDGDSAPFSGITTGTAIGTDTDVTRFIAVADVDGDGDLDVVAGNGGQNKWYANDSAITPFGSVTTGTGVGTDTDSTQSIAVGDVDGDGDLDVVAGNGGQNKWYANAGDSAPFSGAGSGTAIGTDTDDTWSIAIVDVDGDGDLDVVAGNYGQTNKWYANDGDSAPFSEITTGTAIGTDNDSTLSIAVADVDGDGDLDVVAGNDGQTNKWYANDGDSAPFSGVGAGTGIGTDTDFTYSVAVVDADGDGDLDVLAGNDGQNKWYANDGDSAPFSGLTTGTGIGTDTDWTLSLGVGDVDGDGDLDVVAGNDGQNKWYANDGGSTPFSSVGAGTGIETGKGFQLTYSVALVDVDGDGDLDVLAGNYGQTNRWYVNDGDSAPFSGAGSGTAIGTATVATSSIAVADVDGDGDLDVVAGNDGQNKWYANDGGSAPFASAGVSTGVGTDTDSTRSVAVGDVDGDGDLDVVIGNDGQNRWYANDGDSAPFSGVTTGTPLGTDMDTTQSIVLSDVDGDGDLDVVAGNDGQNKWYVNDGSSTPFTTPTATGTAIGTDTDNTYSVRVADVDGDGGLDVVAGNHGQNKWYANDGTSTPFTTPTAIGTAIGTDTDITLSIAVADVDGDGNLDVVTGNFDARNRWYANDGSSTPFTTPTATGTAIGTDTDNTYSVRVADVDGDGDLDVVAGNNGRNKWYANDGSSTPFTTPTATGTSIGTDTDWTLSLGVADVDGDGDLDVVAGNFDATNKWYANDGASTPFTTPTATGTAIGTDTDGTFFVAVVDMDDDGDLDVVAGNRDEANTLHLNRSYDTGLGVATSLKVNGSETNIARATLSGTGLLNTSSTRNTDILFYLSNDGGAKWHQVNPPTAFDFPTFGSDLRWKMRFASLSPVVSPQINSLTIEENLLTPSTMTALLLREAFTVFDTNLDGALSISEAFFASLAELKAYDVDDDGLLTLVDLLELTVGPVGVASTVYLDFAYGGTESGTLGEPFDSLLEAATFVAIGGTVSITAGTSSETILINKNVDLISTGGTVTIGTP